MMKEIFPEFSKSAIQPLLYQSAFDLRLNPHYMPPYDIQIITNVNREYKK